MGNQSLKMQSHFLLKVPYPIQQSFSSSTEKIHFLPQKSRTARARAYQDSFLRDYAIMFLSKL